MNQISSMILLLAVTTLLLTSPALATAPQEKQGHHGMKHNGTQAHSKMKKKKGHHFAPHWAKTLSDEQKTAVDRMHLKLNSELSILKAQLELAQKELNVYTINDDAKTAKINGSIDKLLTLKKKILTKRYAHIREMRAALNTEQRTSYDMAVLKRSGAK